MATLEIIPQSAITLYEIETDLLSLVDSAETATPEQEAEYVAELRQTMEAAVAKRDRVQAFLVHLEAQAAAADAEITRLKARKDWFLCAIDKMETYVVKILESLGPDERGKPRRLEGKTVTFKLHPCPPSVQVLHEEEIPASYKRVTFTAKLSQTAWEALLDSMDLELRAQLLDSGKVQTEPDKPAIKKALDANTLVAGCDLAIGKNTLSRK